MISVIQRVKSASVTVDSIEIGKINQGILALVAVQPKDTQKSAEKLVDKILNYRIFADHCERMNLNLRDIQGGLLFVPQFTLAANTEKGNRPSFTSAAQPDYANDVFNYLSDYAKHTYFQVAFGKFGADMSVQLINDGPVTFVLNII